MKPFSVASWRRFLLPMFIAPLAWSQHADHANIGATPSAEQLGSVDFPVTCSPDAQAEFNRGMALFHSFWFEPARQSFVRVLALDAECSMAYWGIAIMSMGNPFTWPPTPAALAAAADALANARRTPPKSERERDYVAALSTYLEDPENRDHRTRAVALEHAMLTLTEKYPADDEARIFYALVLNVTAVPTDKTFANQREAAEILEPLFRRYPDHPGVAHYLVHTHDYTELAEVGLPAARAYAEIAPSVPHALHMPSHIFSRLGLWQEMIESNRASYEAAKAELTEAALDIGTYDALHAMDYLVYGHLQLAQDQAALSVADEVRAIQRIDVENLPAAYAFAAIPARIALERGDWQQAAGLQLSPSGLAWGRFPQAEGISVFARGLGAARSGDPAAARQHVERLAALRALLADANSTYWVGQTDFQITAVNAWIALAERQGGEAVRLMRAAADAEDASDKHPVTPGNVAPSRELLGDMLLTLDEPALALQEYERSLMRDPNRLRALYGAGRAAESSGNDALAQAHYTRLMALTGNRDTDRAELAHAMDYLATH